MVVLVYLPTSSGLRYLFLHILIIITVDNMKIPQKSEIELSFDPAVSLLGKCPEGMKSMHERVICALMSVAVQFTKKDMDLAQMVV